MGDNECREFLGTLHFGHLGLADGDDPYVVPVHFAVADDEIFIFTTLGMKAEILEKNPKVCLQAESVAGNEDWKSVIVKGVAKRISDPKKITSIKELIRKNNPRLQPALSVRWMDHWVRENIEVVYEITPTLITGRKTKAQKKTPVRMPKDVPDVF